jgi:ribosomal protein S18 acetylase RimI-like enzyme
MGLCFREMTIDDYEASYSLWKETDGMVLSDADSKPAIAGYLERNPGCSFVCEEGGRIIGTILCGHDGRRGYIYHAAVLPERRGHGIGKRLVDLSLAMLQAVNIMKCHLFVVADNEIGSQFWNHTGWVKRDGIIIFSANT